MRTIARRTSKINGRRTTDGKSLVDGDDADGTPYPSRRFPDASRAVTCLYLSARHTSSYICHKFRYRSPPVCYQVCRLPPLRSGQELRRMRRNPRA